MRALRVLLISFAAFFALEAALFHSNFYISILSPDSSTGVVERFLFVERDRKKDAPGQVLGIGNSRMGLLPRVANQITAETGLTFGTIAVPGTSPRCWYYMLRDNDPQANKYAAVVIALDNFNDDESWEHHADRYLDTRLLAYRLKFTDLWEYAASFDTWAYKWEAARSIIFKSSVLALDFQDFLLHPAKRLEDADASRRNSHEWFYNYAGPITTMEGVQVDWDKKTLTVPADRTPAQKAAYELQLLRPLPPDAGEHRKYMHYWMGKIAAHYRGSKTKLVFVRLPRGPFVRPDFPPEHPHGSPRDLAAAGDAVLIAEHRFDYLEHPDMFQDEMHLNGPGMDDFSKTLAREIQGLLKK